MTQPSDECRDLFIKVNNPEFIPPATSRVILCPPKITADEHHLVNAGIQELARRSSKNASVPDFKPSNLRIAEQLTKKLKPIPVAKKLEELRVCRSFTKATIMHESLNLIPKMADSLLENLKEDSQEFKIADAIRTFVAATLPLARENMLEEGKRLHDTRMGIRGDIIKNIHPIGATFMLQESPVVLDFPFAAENVKKQAEDIAKSSWRIVEFPEDPAFKKNQKRFNFKPPPFLRGGSTRGFFRGQNRSGYSQKAGNWAN